MEFVWTNPYDRAACREAIMSKRRVCTPGGASRTIFFMQLLDFIDVLSPDTKRIVIEHISVSEAS
jgi:hypothetical protein